MSIETTLTLNAKPFERELNQTARTANSAMGDVANAMSSVDKATLTMENRFRYARIRLGDLLKLWKEFGSGEISTGAAAAAGSIAVLAINSLRKQIKNLQEEQRRANEIMHELAESQVKDLGKIDEAYVKQRKNVIALIEELRRLMNAEKQTYETQTRQEVLLEKLKKKYEELNGEALTRVELEKKLIELSERENKKMAERQIKQLEREIKVLDTEIEDFNNKLENKGSTSVFGAAGQYLHGQAQAYLKSDSSKNSVIENFVKYSGLPWAISSFGDSGVIPGVTSSGEESELAKKRSAKLAERTIKNAQLNEAKKSLVDIAENAEAEQRIQAAKEKDKEAKIQKEEAKKRTKLDKEATEARKKIARKEADNAYIMEARRYSSNDRVNDAREMTNRSIIEARHERDRELENVNKLIKQKTDEYTEKVQKLKEEVEQMTKAPMSDEAAEKWYNREVEKARYVKSERIADTEENIASINETYKREVKARQDERTYRTQLGFSEEEVSAWYNTQVNALKAVRDKEIENQKEVAEAAEKAYEEAIKKLQEMKEKRTSGKLTNDEAQKWLEEQDEKLREDVQKFINDLVPTIDKINAMYESTVDTLERRFNERKVKIEKEKPEKDKTQKYEYEKDTILSNELARRGGFNSSVVVQSAETEMLNIQKEIRNNVQRISQKTDKIAGEL